MCNPELRQFSFSTSAPRYRREILINGQIFLSSNGNIGEIGYIQVDPPGERCHCGNFGCLDTIATNTAIKQRVRRLLSQSYASKLTTEVIEQVGRQLGKVIALSINLFSPQKWCWRVKSPKPRKFHCLPCSAVSTIRS